MSSKTFTSLLTELTFILFLGAPYIWNWTESNHITLAQQTHANSNSSIYNNWWNKKPLVYIFVIFCIVLVSISVTLATQIHYIANTKATAKEINFSVFFCCRFCFFMLLFWGFFMPKGLRLMSFIWSHVFFGAIDCVCYVYYIFSLLHASGLL